MKNTNEIKKQKYELMLNEIDFTDNLFNKKKDSTDELKNFELEEKIEVNYDDSTSIINKFIFNLQVVIKKFLSIFNQNYHFFKFSVFKKSYK
jgi:hypothetical protein